MRLSSWLWVCACIGVSSLGCSESTEPSDAQASLATSVGCVTDFSCGFGQECNDGSCGPLTPALRPHIQTGIVLFRAPLDGAETEWIATHYDMFIGAVRPNEMRPFNPNLRMFEYTFTRYHTYETGEKNATEWALDHGWDPEDFYLHYREDVTIPTWEGRVIVPGFPAGTVPGWNPSGGNPASATQRKQSRVVSYYRGSPEPTYFANVGHPGYRQYMIERLAGLVDGTWYFNQPYAGGPIDGVLCDEAIYYAVFGEGRLDRSSEYYGLPVNDMHPYAIAIENFYPFLANSLMNEVGTTVDVMPNYGHVLYLNYPNHSAIQVQATMPWILGEVWVTYTGTSTPTSGNNRCITYDKDYVNAVREIVDQTRTRGRRILGARDASNGWVGSDRGKIFTLALYYLMHNAHTYYVYDTVEHSTDHVSTWAYNPAVDYYVGQPATVPVGWVDFEGNANTREHFVFASGADPYAPNLTYRVLARRFTNALVLVKMLPLGSVVDDRSFTTHQLPGPYRVLEADGTLGLIVTEARLRNNEALILIPETMTGVD